MSSYVPKEALPLDSARAALLKNAILERRIRMAKPAPPLAIVDEDQVCEVPPRQPVAASGGSSTDVIIPRTRRPVAAYAGRGNKHSSQYVSFLQKKRWQTKEIKKQRGTPLKRVVFKILCSAAIAAELPPN